MEQWGKQKLKSEGVVVTTSREHSKPSLRARAKLYYGIRKRAVSRPIIMKAKAAASASSEK